MKHGPWTSGPRELLDHAKDHLDKATDVDNRFAMISVDNAVELMLKTYLILPERVTGLTLTRREKEEHTKYFSSALSKVEELVPDEVSSVPLAEIEWFHEIRNQLYHEGNAITVERDKVQTYLKHAELLMRCLFGTEVDAPRYIGGLFDLDRTKESARDIRTVPAKEAEKRLYEGKLAVAAWRESLITACRVGDRVTPVFVEDDAKPTGYRVASQDELLGESAILGEGLIVGVPGQAGRKYYRLEITEGPNKGRTISLDRPWFLNEAEVEARRKLLR